MDKSTLSNYGWVVIAVLVLSVMIALATPFGDYIGNAVKSTTEGLFDVQQKAMGVAGLVVDDQKFENGNAPVLLGYKYGNAEDILSVLPEWDKENYPYAIITYDSTTEEYKLLVASDPFIKFSDTYTPDALMGGYNIDAYIHTDGGWQHAGLNWDPFAPILPPVWASHNVKDSETILVEASEPVPVYE